MSSPITSDGRVGKYRLVKRLAVGGMADIWLAQEYGPRGYERTAVVKTIRADLTDEDELIQMLMEEARIAACLEHPNIVELYEVGEEDETHYLAMEFVFGRDLRQIRDHCLENDLKIPHEHIVTIVAGVLDALHYAYNEATYDGRPLRVIHRDVSPQNIIIGFDGTVKLLDFGIAKAAAQLSRTRAGVLKGKYGYMAPEQVDFKNIDQRADVFSTGIVLWEMLTRKRLFYRKSEYETVQSVLTCQVPFPRAVRSDVPWTLAWIAYRALRKNQRWRYGNGRAMQRALLSWDRRSPEEATDQLAGWMASLYDGELQKRDNALIRALKEPTRHRQVLDAGFELVEEETRRDRVPKKPNEGAAVRPRPADRENTVRASAGLLGLAGATVATWRWFLVILGSLVGLGLATGIYLASLQNVDPTYGYLTVRAGSPEVKINIGGRDVGVAPVRDVLVIPGRHRIIGTYRNETATIEIVVPKGGREVVILDLPQGSRKR